MNNKDVYRLGFVLSLIGVLFYWGQWLKVTIPEETSGKCVGTGIIGVFITLVVVYFFNQIRSL